MVYEGKVAILFADEKYCFRINLDGRVRRLVACELPPSKDTFAVILELDITDKIFSRRKWRTGVIHVAHKYIPKIKATMYPNAIEGQRRLPVLEGFAVGVPVMVNRGVI